MRGAKNNRLSWVISFLGAHSPPDSPSARGHFITFPRLKNAKVINGAPPVDAGDGHRRHGAQACRAHTSRTISIHAPVSLPQARLLGPTRDGHARPLVSYRTAFYRSRNGTGNRLAQPRSLPGHAKGCSPFREKRNALDVRFFGRFFVSHNIMNLIEELKFIQLFWPNLWPISRSASLPVGAITADAVDKVRSLFARRWANSIKAIRHSEVRNP